MSSPERRRRRPISAVTSAAKASAAPPTSTNVESAAAIAAPHEPDHARRDVLVGALGRIAVQRAEVLRIATGLLDRRGNVLGVRSRHALDGNRVPRAAGDGTNAHATGGHAFDLRLVGHGSVR